MGLVLQNHMGRITVCMIVELIFSDEQTVFVVYHDSQQLTSSTEDHVSPGRIEFPTKEFSNKGRFLHENVIFKLGVDLECYYPVVLAIMDDDSLGVILGTLGQWIDLLNV